jgi:hypothetical protein
VEGGHYLLLLSGWQEEFGGARVEVAKKKEGIEEKHSGAN